MSSHVPLVSVIMPVYNPGEYLAEAIESILNQTFMDFEFIILCDDPSFKTREIIDNYQKNDNRIIVFYQKKEGLVASLNKGCSAAKGKYIARMDADDVSHPQRFEKQIEYLECNSDIGLCGTWANLIDKNGRIIDFFKPSSSPNLIKWDLHFFCAIAHPSVIIRKSFFDRNGQYLDSDIHCEDYALWVRAFNNTKMSNIPLVLINLRKHDLNVSKTYSEIQITHAMKVSQIALSSTLKKKISLNNVQIIYRQANNFPAEDYMTTIKNLRQLQHLYVEIPVLSHEEKKYIRKSMCTLLYNIGILPFFRNPVLSLYLFVLSFISEPFFFFERLIFRIFDKLSLKNRMP